MSEPELSAADKAYLETRKHFEVAQRDQTGRYD
jgi:hypothetical protein